MGRLLAPARALAARRPGQGSQPDFRARTGGQSLRHWKRVVTSRGFPTGPASGSGMEGAHPT